jgi:hypothetical protein
MVPVTPSDVELRATLRTRITDSSRRDLSKAFVFWLLRQPEGSAEFASIATRAAKREGADQDFQTIAILGLAADAGILSESEIVVLKDGLGRLAGRIPVVNGVPMGFPSDPAGILGVAVGTAAIADPAVFRRVADWAARFLKSSYERERAEDWERCLFAAADRKIGHPLGLPIPTSAATADVRIALLSVDMLDGSDVQPRKDAALTLSLAGQDSPEDFSCERAALRLKALEWLPNAHLSISAEEELNAFKSADTEALRSGPDVHVFWGPFWTGGMLSFRNEGTEAAKNVRLQCSAESGWRPIVRPEVVASISPGATVRVVDESRNTPGQGQSIADFVHSLPSKEHAMTVTFEDRLGEQRMRDFRVVAAGTHAITEALAVTFFAGALRTDGTRTLKNLVGRMRAIRDAAEIGKVLSPASANADRSRTAGSVQMARGEGAKEAQELRKDRNGKTLTRRNPKYKVIDEALKEIAESQPRTQEEVFQSLEGRHVVIPACEPFVTARGWMAGFRRNESLARQWLSKRWAELHLPSFLRGPKRKK